MVSNFLSKTDNYILRLLKFFLAACLATPLLASVAFIFPYTAPKVFAFRILVELAAALYLYLALKYPNRLFFSIFCHSRENGNPGPGSRVKPGMTIGVAILAFLFINLFSAIFGADFYTSFWGNLERGMGVWSLAHFAVWFLMLSVVFKEKKGWINLIKLSVAASLIVAATALIQRFGGLGELLPATGRVYGLIGNAGVLGSYLIFNVFLAGYLLIMSLRGAPIFIGVNSRRSNPAGGCKSTGSPRAFGARGDKIRFIVYCLLLTVNCLALFFSGTRGAWLGLLAGIIVFLVLTFFTPPFFPPEADPPLAEKGGRKAPRRAAWPQRGFTPWGPRPFTGEGFKGFKKLSLISLCIIFVFIASLFLFRNSSFIQNNPALSRLTVISLSEASIQSRLILWQDSWRAWQARPPLGFGPENFEAGIGKYLSPRLADFEAYATDRSHNFIFDYGVTTGWLGLVSYLMMICAAGWLSVKQICHSEHIRFAQYKLREESKRSFGLRPQDDKQHFFFSVISLSLLAAYLVQNLFIFDSFVSYLMLFFVLALISDTSLRAQRSNPVGGEISAGLPRRAIPLERNSTPRNDSFNFFKKLILLLAIGYSLFNLYSFNLKPLLAASRANQILFLPASEATQAAPLLKDALALNTFASPEIAYQAVLDYIDKISQNSALAQNEEFYNAAAGGLSNIIERSPGRARNYIALAWLNLYFSASDPQRINNAADLGNKIKDLSPNKKDAYLILVAAYALSGRSDRAQAIISQAAAVDGKMGEEVGTYYEKLK